MKTYNGFCIADLYPSNIHEWEPVTSLSGIIDVIHSEIGKLQYKGRTAKELADSGIFFYDAMYIPDLNGRIGKLECIPLPSFQDNEWWIAPNDNIIKSFRSKLYNDIQKSLKISTGSKNVHLNWFVPLSLFVNAFSITEVRRTPTLFICKNLSDDFFLEFMDKGWDQKSNGDIECRIKHSSICFRYNIEKQMLTGVFHYQRWKKHNGIWSPLDQDLDNIGHTDRICIDIVLNEDSLTTIEVEQEWSLFYIRTELVLLQHDIPDYFSFIANGKLVCDSCLLVYQFLFVSSNFNIRKTTCIAEHCMFVQIRKRHEEKIKCKDLGGVVHIIEQS